MTFTPGTLSSGRFTGLPDEALEAALDSAWATRSAATDEACQVLAARILTVIDANVPHVTRVILREDRSHLPAHGHVDAVITADGIDVMTSLVGMWHDLQWSSTVDEDVWDLYHLAPHLFVRDDADGIRRLTLVPADPTPEDSPL